MGIFNRAIPKYTRNPIDNTIKVEPVTESVQEPNIEPVALVDDAFDPLFNKAVRKRLIDMHGDPFTATLSGYAELLETAIGGNRDKGGNVLPGVGILSSFGRTMDKAGDFILGGLTETVKGVTGQGMENPLYNIFTQDQDYSGQRFLTAAANSMSKMAGGTKLTEGDFKGLWSVPSLGIELMTDPSILGGGLTRVAKGTGAVADAGRILQEYDDIMAKFAIDATAPGLRPLGKKFGAKVGSYIHNLRTEKELRNATLQIEEIVEKAVIDFDNGTMSPEEFNATLKRVREILNAYQKQADQDVIGKPLKEMANEVERATQSASPPISSFRDNNAFLSNMFESPIVLDGVSYKNAEAAFQAGKLEDPSLRVQFSELSGADAKKLGRKVKLRENWDDYKIEHMRKVLKAKFEQNPELMKLLQATGDAPLIEGNDWGDRFWGVYKGEGGNNLGKLLEEVRGRNLTNTRPSSPPTRQQRLNDWLDTLQKSTETTNISSMTGAKLNDYLAQRQQALNEIIDYLDKTTQYNVVPKSYVADYRSNPDAMFKDLGVPNPAKDPNYSNIDWRDSTKPSGFTVEENEEFFLDKMPSDFVEKYNITKRQDLVNLLNSTDSQTLDDLEYLFSHLLKKEGYVSDSLKVSQSMSKLDPEIQIRIANNIQHLMSEILTVGVGKGIISASDISENTLDDLFDEVYSYLNKQYREFVPTGNRGYDTYKAFSYYSYNSDYLKKILEPYARKTWNSGKANAVYLKNGKKLNGKPIWEKYKTFDEFLDKTVSRIRGQISNFESYGSDYIKQNGFYNTFLDDFVFSNNPHVGSTITFRTLANKMLDDEVAGVIPISKRTKSRFPNLSARPNSKTKISASKIIEEFNEFNTLMGYLEASGGSLKYKVPVKYVSYTNTAKDAEKFAKRLSSHAQRTDDLNDYLRYIKHLVNNYEYNIGSKIGGRLPNENILKYVEYDRTTDLGEAIKPYINKKATLNFGRTSSEDSIGLSNAINKILQRKRFTKPIEVYEFLHKPFKTSLGEFTLSELGIEVTKLPSTLTETMQTAYKHGFTIPVKLKGKTFSFEDVLSKKFDNIEWFFNNQSTQNITVENFEKIIPKQIYQDNFEKLTNIGYTELFRRFKQIPKSKFNKEDLIDALTVPETRVFNRYTDATVDPKVMYLNRLRPELGNTVFNTVTDVIGSSKSIGNVVKKSNPPSAVRVFNINESYEESVIKAIEEVPDETFEQLVTNEWKIYQESDLEKRAEMINKAFPDKEPITAAELRLYEEFGQGGKSPVTRVIEERHPVQISLYDLLSKEFKNSIVAKQDRNAVLELPKLKEIIEESVRLQGVAGGEMPKILTLLDKQKGSMVRGADFLTDLALAKGRKIIAYKDVNDGKLVKDVLASIQSNVDAVNNAAGGEVIKVINHVNEAGQHIVGYRLVGNQKLFKNLSKNLDGLRLNDIVFEPVSALTKEESDFLATYSPVVEHLSNVQREASEYYRKIGFQYNDPSFFKHTFDNSKFFQDTVNNNYYKGLDIKRSEGLSDMIIDLGYFGDLRGQFGAVPNSRIFEGNISRYGDMFDTNINSITKSTFTKGVFANEKFQTTMSIFDNNEFRLNTYCKNLDDVKNILNSEANLRNLTIASVEYKDGMIYGFKKYDNFSDSSLAKALQDENAVFLPTHIFSTLDKFCKQRIRMSNKVYAFINRYLTAPFKIGVLLNPGFLLGNLNDAYLKQATTMSKKYGTSVAEELANVASSMRTTIFLNNRFSDVYDVYLKDMETYGIDIPANYKMSLQVAKSKGARDHFIKYLNGTLEGFDKSTSTKYLINPNLTEEDVGISRVWIYLNAVQPTEGITKELAGDLVENGAGKVNYAKNPVDRVLYGLRYYKPSDITTHGLLNNLGTKSVFGMSEATESLARSAAILNDLRHQGIDLTEFGKILGSTADTEFNVKMINAINAMHNANFDYNASSPLLEGLEGFVPFPTFWIKNLGYWFDMFINHPQYIDAALQVNEGLWANEDTSEDEFKADAKSRGAIPLSAFNEPKSGQKLSNFFKGIYKPSPLQSMFTAFGTLNNPIETTFQRTHPLIQGAAAVAGTEPMFNNLTTYLQNPEDIRYRPYNTNQYQPNIDSTEEEFNPLAYAGHKLNPFDRVMNTYLRTPGKVKRGEAQLSDFLPSVFQPDFSKK